jgi:hypothetical protein
MRQAPRGFRFPPFADAGQHCTTWTVRGLLRPDRTSPAFEVCTFVGFCALALTVVLSTVGPGQFFLGLRQFGNSESHSTGALGLSIDPERSHYTVPHPSVRSVIQGSSCRPETRVSAPCRAAKAAGDLDPGVGLEGWVNLSIASAPPLNGSDNDLATYDEAINATLLLQVSCAGGPCAKPPTWEFVNHSWTEVSSNSELGARGGATMSYDPAARDVLLYGGVDAQGDGTTWTYQNGTWTNVSVGVSPGPLIDSGMAYDEFDGYMLLYSGLNRSSSSISNDTWEYQEGSWTSVSPTGQIPPPSEFDNNPMVYDPELESVVFFDATNWTYLYQSGNWQAINIPIPGNLGDQGGGSLAYDPLSGDVLYMGGHHAGGFTNQIWAFNGTGWALLRLVKDPPPTYGPCWLYDPSVGGVLLFGGGDYGDFQNNNQTWVFGAGNVTFTSTPVDGGKFDLAGTIYSGGESAWVPYGLGLPKLDPNLGFYGTNLSFTGNFTFLNGSLRLTGNASLLGQFRALPTVALEVKPGDCEVEFNGTSYSNGSSVYFAPGQFGVDARNCAGVNFDQWVVSGNGSAAEPFSNQTTVTLTGSTRLSALYRATLTFQASPPFTGTLLFNGSAVALDSPQSWVAQTYPVGANAAPGWRLAGFSVTGGVTISARSATIQAAGSIQANFVQFPTLTFATSLERCATIQFNGSSISSGASSGILLGNYPVSAPTCSDALFENWSGSGGVAVAARNSIITTANVTGNGTLTADYVPAAWVNLTVQPSAEAGSIIWNGSPVRNGSYFETLTGDYAPSADPANGWHFVSWGTQGGIRPIPGSFDVSANGSLTADFQINATSPGGNQTGMSAYTLTVWEWVASGAITVGIVASAFVLFNRRRSGGGQRDDI